MIPIADLVGASVLTLGAIFLIIIAIATLQFLRGAGKSSEYKAQAEASRAKNEGNLIKIQADNSAIQKQNMRTFKHIARHNDRLLRSSDTHTALLKKAITQLTELTAAQGLHNGNSAIISASIADIKSYIEGCKK